jgi:hypothetical protein
VTDSITEAECERLEEIKRDPMMTKSNYWWLLSLVGRLGSKAARLERELERKDAALREAKVALDETEKWFRGCYQRNCWMPMGAEDVQRKVMGAVDFVEARVGLAPASAAENEGTGGEG